jgi:putative sterol carrier protein
VSDATEAFFAELAERGSEPLLGDVRGVLRFDLRSGKRTEHWRVAIKRGAVEVSRGDGAADVVVVADRDVFSKIATGEANATAAILRGVVAVTGETDLVVQFQRIFPGPQRGAIA